MSILQCDNKNVASHWVLPMIPDFKDDGLLPPGVHEATLEELREKLGFTRRRRTLIDGLERALELMSGCGVRQIYIDGSFVTDKPRPNDIDGCYDVESGMDHSAMAPIWPLTHQNRVKSKELYGVGFFPADMIEAGSGQPFLQFFQQDGEGNPKGVVAMELRSEVR